MHERFLGITGQLGEHGGDAVLEQPEDGRGRIDSLCLLGNLPA
ncbi:hypothetical protein V1227_14730 [Lentzea sp. DG1S-22]|nr:hypothetical protein [Lentzea sp. DG1S-22]WVH83948.1 hypothetical protein V1227_14730 [Lentzea sp. DG1S-22]